MKQIFELIYKNRKVIIGGAAIVGGSIVVFKTDRTIKKMKLDNAETTAEYGKILKEIEEKLAYEILDEFTRKQLQIQKKHYQDKIAELESQEVK